MLDDGNGFSLVPWRPVVEQRLGQQVSAIVRGVIGHLGVGAAAWTVGAALSEEDRKRRDLTESWPYAPHLLRLLEEQATQKRL